MKKVWAIIPARAGSKGVPDKNVKRLGGKPLIAYSISAALEADCVERVIVSTDAEKIAAVGIEYGAEVPFLRPSDLASDTSAVIDAVEHLVENLKDRDHYVPDYILLLQPTSPLRTVEDIEAAYQKIGSSSADAVVSVTAARDHPWQCNEIDEDGMLISLVSKDKAAVRRQDLPPVYTLNGAIYLIKTDVLLETRSWYPARTAAYVMPPERSVDIDTLMEFEWAERMIINARTSSVGKREDSVI